MRSALLTANMATKVSQSVREVIPMGEKGIHLRKKVLLTGATSCPMVQHSSYSTATKCQNECRAVNLGQVGCLQRGKMHNFLSSLRRKRCLDDMERGRRCFFFWYKRDENGFDAVRRRGIYGCCSYLRGGLMKKGCSVEGKKKKKDKRHLHPMAHPLSLPTVCLY